MAETITLVQRGPPGTASLPSYSSEGIPAAGDSLLFSPDYDLWVYKTSVDWSTGFASVGSNAFQKVCPGKSTIVCVCGDANHVALTGETGLVFAVY